MIRSFIGLPMPPHAVRALEALQTGLPVAREVPGENLHLTLVFLDDQPQAVLRALAEELDGLALPPVDLRLSGLDVLGGRQPGAIAVRADGGEALTVLQAKVARTVRTAGIPLERRRFRPHVTIFRLPQRLSPADTARIQAWLGASAGFDPVHCRIDSMVLYRSILAKSGALYDALADYPLDARTL